MVIRKQWLELAVTEIAHRFKTQVIKLMKAMEQQKKFMPYLITINCSKSFFLNARKQEMWIQILTGLFTYF